MKPGYRQEVLNVVLAQILQERGVVSVPEKVVREVLSKPGQRRMLMSWWILWGYGR